MKKTEEGFAQRREEAEKQGLKVIGTLGVIVAAHEGSLLDLTETLDRLRQTTFYCDCHELSKEGWRCCIIE